MDCKTSQMVGNLAERVGFEPTLPFRVNTLSKRAPSATRPSLPAWTNAGDDYEVQRANPYISRTYVSASILWVARSQGKPPATLASSEASKIRVLNLRERRLFRALTPRQCEQWRKMRKADLRQRVGLFS